MELCNFKDMLGKPNEGVHRYNALADWLMTIVMAIILGTITWFIDSKINIEKPIPILFSIFLWFTILYILAIFFHYIFCVKSRVSIFLGLTS